MLIYVVAAIINLYIPRVALDHKMPKKNPLYLLHDFVHSFKLLWRDPLGQVSLAVTTLFWGAGATLRLIVLTWAGMSLKFTPQQATQLTAVTAIGIAIGAILAAKFVSLRRSVRVLPVGIFMGLAVLAMVVVHDWRVAIVILVAVGIMGGFFVVPMNALLQHRGHLLMGAGHSIAVQNFIPHSVFRELIKACELASGEKDSPIWLLWPTTKPSKPNRQPSSRRSPFC